MRGEWGGQPFAPIIYTIMSTRNVNIVSNVCGLSSFNFLNTYLLTVGVGSPIGNDATFPVRFFLMRVVT